MSKSPDLLLHQPVLLAEALEALNLHFEGIYVDCTFGCGGHSKAILRQLGTLGQVLAFDQDPEAVQIARKIGTIDKRFTIIHSCFAHLIKHIKMRNLIGQVNGVLLDLGVSSPQLDNPTRGFSFSHDGPLDMRMNPHTGETIGKWLSEVTAKDIAKVLKTYGEERYAHRIAQAIVNAREQTELTTTRQLANIIATAHPAWEKSKHPATRSFQALRIFINRELEQLHQVLPQILNVLAPKGRLVIISFHSLEDRIVKRFIRDCVKGDDFPAQLPVTQNMLCPSLRSIYKPIFPTPSEIATNPRARSAIMRVAEKI